MIVCYKIVTGLALSSFHLKLTLLLVWYKLTHFKCHLLLLILELTDLSIELSFFPFQAFSISAVRSSLQNSFLSSVILLVLAYLCSYRCFACVYMHSLRSKLFSFLAVQFCCCVLWCVCNNSRWSSSSGSSANIQWLARRWYHLALHQWVRLQCASCPEHHQPHYQQYVANFRVSCHLYWLFQRMIFSPLLNNTVKLNTHWNRTTWGKMKCFC